MKKGKDKKTYFTIYQSTKPGISNFKKNNEKATPILNCQECVCVSVCVHSHHLHSNTIGLQISLFKIEISLGIRENGYILLRILFVMRIYMRLVISEHEYFDTSITAIFGIVGLD